jgi:S-adenosylmethionine synthetase
MDGDRDDGHLAMAPMQVIIQPLAPPEAAAPRVEIVERKGRGHPDTLCDAAAEALSIALSRRYLARTGRIQHHNVDKAVLCAGGATAGFGGGVVTEPMRLIHVGRAAEVSGVGAADIASLAAAVTRDVFSRSLRHLDAPRHLQVESRIRPTSRALGALFAGGQAVALANDSSIGCGFAPLSVTERLVLDTERYLTDRATLAARPYLGEDVKVLAVRIDDRIELTVAAAFVAAHVPSLPAYLEAKHDLAESLLRHGRERAPGLATVTLNAADRPAAGIVYLTATGTSAEAGDDGQVGRGNRANGLITPSRPMTLEALAGKNPISHVGKLYNAWARDLTRELAARPDIASATCQLASRIGAPITEPQVVWIGVSGPGAGDVAGIDAQVRTALGRMPEMWRDLIAAGAGD